MNLRHKTNTNWDAYLQIRMRSAAQNPVTPLPSNLYQLGISIGKCVLFSTIHATSVKYTQYYGYTWKSDTMVLDPWHENKANLSWSHNI